MTRRIVSRMALAIAVSILPAGRLPVADAHVVWSDQPVVVLPDPPKPLKYFQHLWGSSVYPIGNGRLGCTIFGGVAEEHIQFNEDTLWTGDEEDTGRYQNFGDLFIAFESRGDAVPAAGTYRRELDIEKAIHTIRYELAGVRYRREYVASHPANVMAFRFSADRKGAFTGTVSLKDAHPGVTNATGNTIAISGALGGRMSLGYEAQVRVLNDGGSVVATNGALRFKDCDSLVILLDAGTDYLNRRDKGWKQEPPHRRIAERLAAASKRSFDDLLAEHVKDYQGLFNRVTLDLGATAADIRSLPTATRLASYRQKKPDPDLEETLFQHARYLMIGSSRPGDLPANLQGVWNTYNNPPWRSDYHTDVNVQMNYWFIDQANLPECFRPLAEWVHSIRDVRRDATWKEFNVRGWATRSENGIFGGATYHWVPGDASWVAQNLWDHYAFTQDKDYLRNRAYPVMKELCEYWEDSLKTNAAGRLVSPKSQSPEHGPFAEGNSYEQQLAWDLFSNFIEASEALGVDREYRGKVADMRARLLGPQIGKWGQLQEWAEDLDDPKDQHRHLSHLIAVHPGRQISPLTTPHLAEAAKVSMNARGDGATGWSKAWKICIWARLQDGDRAYKLIGEFIRGNVYPNLWGYHPPFQIDCNFGYAAGVGEMLVQSHMGFIHLLPALPKAWPAGSVRGMRVRGGCEVDIDWKDGLLAQAAVRRIADASGTVTVRYGKGVAVLPLAQGESRLLKPEDFGGTKGFACRLETGRVWRRIFRGRFVALAILATAALAPGGRSAENKALHVHRIFGSNMVIQRDKDIAIWGWAKPGRAVSVQFGDAKADATAASETGRWEVTFPAQPANAVGQRLIVTCGDEKIEMDNIVIGDVWVMNGQSNMGFSLGKTQEADMEMAQADLPLLRRVDISPNESERLEEDIPADKLTPWTNATPETAGGFSAIGYVFGSRLQRALQIPIGIIDNSRGGASLESLVSRHKFKDDPLAAKYLASVEKRQAEFDWDAEVKKTVGKPAP